MTAEVIFRLLLVGAGAGALVIAVLALAREKMTEMLCLVWGILALLLILAGILLHPAMWNRYLSAKGLILVVLVGICALAAAYFVSVGISELLLRMHEVAIQIALLKFERDLPESRKRKKELLVIVPAYNEEQNIPFLLEQFDASGIREFADVLIIDDGSTDRTRQAVEGLDYLCINGIFHQGYGSALQTGYKYAASEGYPYVIQMDADGQHDICNIAVLYKALLEADEEGSRPDIVLGSRFLQGSSSFPVSGVKMLAIRLFRLILLITTGQRITDPTSGLQGLNARTVSFYAQFGCFDNKYPDANTIMQMLLLGFKLREVPAVMHPRRSGKSIHSGLNPLVYMFRMAFSMSAVYIRASWLGRGKAANDGTQDI